MKAIEYEQLYRELDVKIAMHEAAIVELRRQRAMYWKCAAQRGAEEVHERFNELDGK